MKVLVEPMFAVIFESLPELKSEFEAELETYDFDGQNCT